MKTVTGLKSSNTSILVIKCSLYKMKIQIQHMEDLGQTAVKSGLNCLTVSFLCFCLILYIPVNNFSAMSGQVFLC